jgi:hypothetical protein
MRCVPDLIAVTRRSMIWMSQDFIDHTPSKRSRTLMRTLGILKRLAEQKAAGPTPSFTEVHIAKAIEIIGRKPIGRLGLSERLGLGEANSNRPPFGSQTRQSLEARMRVDREWISDTERPKLETRSDDKSQQKSDHNRPP